MKSFMLSLALALAFLCAPQVQAGEPIFNPMDCSGGWDAAQQAQFRAAYEAAKAAQALEVAALTEAAAVSTSAGTAATVTTTTATAATTAAIPVTVIIAGAAVSCVVIAGGFIFYYYCMSTGDTNFIADTVYNYFSYMGVNG